MDDLVEIALEFLFEFPFDAAMESKRLKTGIKTAIFCATGGSVTLFIILLTVQKWISQDDTKGAFFMTLISLVLLIGVIAGAIHGHKRKWKK